MKQSSETNSSIEVESQHIMDNVHPTGREHTHIETLIQPPRDLDTQEQEDNKHIEVMLADFSTLLV